MKHYIGRHEARNTAEFIELALGTPLELWLGEENETEEERAARLDAARDILADDPGMVDRTTRLAVETIGATMPDLLRLAPSTAHQPVIRPRSRRAPRTGVAA
ncbi:MAG: hypothetical protein JO362_10755 [Streptomycetaceae bacterium]|nr:hypothetical protein [Streptomycetaceae bacterium]